jgi:uroporphyrin-III C-methyltransferase/precorrin-2 dehydrogenase/sirohydrochlorin ferrochelatase
MFFLSQHKTMHQQSVTNGRGQLNAEIYPAFLRLEGWLAVIIGGGAVAEEKAHGLLKAGCRVRVVSRDVTPGLDELARDKRVKLHRRDYRAGDLRGAHLVFATTLESSLNAAVSREAQQRRVLLNAVDEMQYCDFIAPSVHRHGDVVIGISTSGRSPALAVHLRHLIARVVGPEYGRLASLLGSLREHVRSVIPDASDRIAYWRKLAVRENVDAIRRGDAATVQRRALALLRRRSVLGTVPADIAADRTAHCPLPTGSHDVETGIVYIVGAGPGAPDLITRRGLDRLRAADVVVYDRLVHPDLLDEAPADALRVFAGKTAGGRSTPQPWINERLVREARAGKVVVRLKGGDPFVFGRGGEECEALQNAGVRYEVVPGVSAAVAAPAAAGIPVTHREHSSAFAVVAGQGAGSADAGHDWAALAGIPTVVIMMGLETAEEVTSELLRHGRAHDTPAAAIASATLPNQRVVVGTLGTIAARIVEAELESPTTLVVGDVVRYAVATEEFCEPFTAQCAD